MKRFFFVNPSLSRRLAGHAALLVGAAALALLAISVAAAQAPTPEPAAEQATPRRPAEQPEVLGLASALTLTHKVWLPIAQIPPAPAAFTKSAPANNATGLSAGQGVTLSWNASYAAAFYEVCFSQGDGLPCTSGSGFAYTTTQTSWHTGQLIPGVQYFWHVRAVNVSGVTPSDGSQAAVYAFHTRAAPSGFNKNQPLNGSTGHAALAGVTLSWSPASNVDAYRVCLSTAANGCAVWDNYNRFAGASTSYATEPLLPNTTYYWQVRADNDSWFSFADGNVTTYYSFTTQPAPGAFVKQLPLSGSAPGTAYLQWSAATGATGYDICLSATAADCGNPGNYTINTTSLNYTASSLSPGTTYFWNVRAKNGSGFSYANGSIYNIWNFTAPAGSGGTTPCNAPSAAQNTNHTRPQNQSDIYYALTVNQTSTVIMTVTNATGQLQFRTPNLSTCPSYTTTLIDYEPVASGAASIQYYNVTPGTYYARIATMTPGSNNVTFRWSATPGYTFLEPNNTPCAAMAINVNTTYTAYPENSRPDSGLENDYYQFTLAANATVQVQFSGYNAGGRQVQLRGGASCGATSLVDSSAFIADASSGTIQRALSAGTYWVRFVTANGAQSRTPYTFTVSTSNWNLHMNTCWPFPADDSNCGNGSYSGGQLTVYWDGVPGATQVQAIFRGIGQGGCPRPPDRIETFAPPTTPQGSKQITGIQPGYYGLTLKISGPQGTYTRNEMPVKMDCEFSTSSPVFGWPGLNSSEQQDTTGAENESSPAKPRRPTPIPAPGESSTPSSIPSAVATPVP